MVKQPNMQHIQIPQTEEGRRLLETLRKVFAEHPQDFMMDYATLEKRLTQTPNKLETGELRMWAVVPEEGFLDDVLATFKNEAEAELFRSQYRQIISTFLCVVPVYAELGLVTDEDNGEETNA